MSSLTRAQIEEALRSFNDPHLHTDLVAANAVDSIVIDGANVAIAVELGYPAQSIVQSLQQTVVESIKALPGVDQVDVQVDRHGVDPEVGDARLL